MPRLDNQSQDVRGYYGLDEDFNDPGRIPPVDLCEYCASLWEIEDRDDVVEHPPYQEQDPPYFCLDCGEVLTEDDN